MLIDINAYIGHWPFKQLNYNTCEALVGRMDEFGVDFSAVTNLNGIFYKNTQAANEELMEEINSHQNFKQRLIPFAIINPVYPGWKSDFNYCVKMGIKGVRLYPQYHDYELLHPSCVELVKLARDQGMVIALTIRMVDSRQKSWLDLDHVAGTEKSEWTLKDMMPIIKAVPDAKFFILNLANGFQLNDAEKALILNGDVLMDTSGRSISNMAETLDVFGNDKFAFGTHAPILDYLTGLLRIESLRPDEVDEATKTQLRSGNAIKMLNL
ncbi:MAG: amidohydrolase family protein [Cyclobacteriaceae bacterium]